MRTYTENWEEAGLVDDTRFSLNLFVAYDLSYRNTVPSDYTPIRPEVDRRVESTTFVDAVLRKTAQSHLVDEKVLSTQEALLLFGRGYAALRNAVLYFALSHRMDYLIFLDDDEYPVAVTGSPEATLWAGQHVLASHLHNIAQADVTHGRHCGYISPVPFIEFNGDLSEDDFRLFVEAISNDIIDWGDLRAVMDRGGVTYADERVLFSKQASEVPEVSHAKFISGANLGLNLTDPLRLFPFYNPPGARGEDTLLSTCLSDRRVLRVPCYTFHDGFSTCQRLLHGVLPIHLRAVSANDPAIVNRFYRACLGWIRYKPLFIYLTQPEQYAEAIQGIRYRLGEVLPRVAAHFALPGFLGLTAELERYHRRVEEHHRQFLQAQSAWARIMEHLAEREDGVSQTR